jgi:hypothetical protein
MKASYNGIILLVGAILLIGAAPLPFGFYQFLRWAVAIGGAVLIWHSIKLARTGWSIIGGMAILLWLPVFGVTFDKGTWSILDLTFGAAFIAAGLLLKEK